MKLYFENEYTKRPLEEIFGFDCLQAAGRVAGEALKMEKCPYDCELAVTLTDDEGIRGINLETRGIDRPTDVLSFPMVEYLKPGNFSEAEEEEADSFDPESGRLLLGDIVISVDRVIAQAEEYGHSLLREYAFLVAHSMFHLMGYDHMTPDEEEVMTARQEAVLKALQITRDGHFEKS